jgi:hypothetical protein
LVGVLCSTVFAAATSAAVAASASGADFFAPLRVGGRSAFTSRLTRLGLLDGDFVSAAAASSVATTFSASFQ